MHQKIQKGRSVENQQSCSGACSMEKEEQRRAALSMQKIYRGCRSRKDTDSVIRKQFYATFGEKGERACVKDLCTASSDYIPSLLHLFSLGSEDNLKRLCVACELFRLSAKEAPCLWQAISEPCPVATEDSAFPFPLNIIKFRLQSFAELCLNVLYDICLYPNAKERLLLVKTLLDMTDPGFIFFADIQKYLIRKGGIATFRSILSSMLKGGYSASHKDSDVMMEKEERSCLEELFYRLGICYFSTSDPLGPNITPQDHIQCFVLQILTLPLLWKKFPSLTEKIVQSELLLKYLQGRQREIVNSTNTKFPRKDLEVSSLGCLIGNIAAVINKMLECISNSAPAKVDNVSEFLFELQFTLILAELEKKEQLLDKMSINNREVAENKHEIQEVKGQIQRYLFTYSAACIEYYCEHTSEPDSTSRLTKVFKAIFTPNPHVTCISISSNTKAEREMLVRALWSLIKVCHANESWPTTGVLEGDSSLNWIVPVNLFAGIYQRIVGKLDYDRFYKEQDLISLQDIKLLIKILKEKLLNVMILPRPSEPYSAISITNTTYQTQCSIMIHVSYVLRELWAWNCRKQYTSPEDFSATLESIDQIMKCESSLMKHAPFLIPFSTRFDMFKESVRLEKLSHFSRSPIQITVKRQKLLEDALGIIDALSGDDIYKRFKVSFINNSREKEDIIKEVVAINRAAFFKALKADNITKVTLINTFPKKEPATVYQAGMFKKFVKAVLTEACDPKWSLFKKSDNCYLIPNHDSSKLHPDDHLRYFELIGKVLAKAMLEGVLVNPLFNKLLLKMLIGNNNITLNDLLYWDAQLYNDLLSIKNFQGDMSELVLYFVAINESGKEIELKPGGKDVQVNGENVEEYIDLMVDYHIHTKIGDQVKAFKDAFLAVMNSEDIAMFNEEELLIIMSGSSVAVEISDLQANTNYKGFEEDDPLIPMFWEVVTQFDDELRKKLLQFVTGTSRSPVGGFKHLIPVFSITKQVGDNINCLPTASNCDHMLKLPCYNSSLTLKEKLIKAISLDTGFD